MIVASARDCWVFRLWHSVCIIIGQMPQGCGGRARKRGKLLSSAKPAGQRYAGPRGQRCFTRLLGDGWRLKVYLMQGFGWLSAREGIAMAHALTITVITGFLAALCAGIGAWGLILLALDWRG